MALSKLPPSIFNPNAPSLYGQGLTNYEIIVKLAYKINECIDEITSYTELMLALKDYLDELDETVKEKVTEELQKLFNDGTLSSIIQNFVNEWLANHTLAKSETLTTVREWRKVCATGVNDTWNTSLLYSYSQGACVYRNSNNQEKMAIIQVLKDRATAGVENNQISIFNKNNQNAERSAVLPIGHGQDICYKDGYFYIAQSTIHSGTASTKITRVSESTLTYNAQDDKEFPNHQPYCITTHNDDILVYDLIDSSIYRLDWDAATLTYLYGVDTNGQTVNGMTAKNDFLFIVTGESLTVYDIADGTKIWAYNIKDISDDLFRRGEIEAISAIPDSNRIAIFTNCTQGITSGSSAAGANVPGAQRVLVQRFVVDPFRNQVMTPYLNTLNNPANHLTVYVTGDTTVGQNCSDDMASVINPNGLAGAPFANRQEAVDYFANTDCGSLEIRLNDRNDHVMCLISGLNVNIRNYKSSDGAIQCGTTLIENGASVTLQGYNENRMLEFLPSIRANTGNFTASDGSLQALNCSLKIRSNVNVKKDSSDARWGTATNALDVSLSTYVRSNTNINVDGQNISNSLTNRDN